MYTYNKINKRGQDHIQFVEESRWLRIEFRRPIAIGRAKGKKNAAIFAHEH